MHDRPLPVSFREEIVGVTLKALMNEQSCSLVGVGSSGKSNVARHLARLDVRQHHLGVAAASTLCAYVDCAKLIEVNAPALYRLIFEAVLAAMQPPAAGRNLSGIATQCDAWWQQATESHDVPIDRIRRNLEQTLTLVLQSGISKLFILLDDFDRIVREAPGALLNSLRALRDGYKGKLMFVTFTRRELDFLTYERKHDPFQDFLELISKTIPVGPYSDADAQMMMDRLAHRYGLASRLDRQARRLVVELSGYHPGLIKVIVEIIEKDPAFQLTSDGVLDRLARDPHVEAECKNIWVSLEAEEHLDVKALARKVQPDGKGLYPLERKGVIIRRINGTHEIASPLFAAHVFNECVSDKSRLKLNAGRAIQGNHGVIKVDPVVFCLAEVLLAKHPQPVHRGELWQAFASVEPRPSRFTGRTDQRFARYVAELKQMLNTAHGAPALVERGDHFWLEL